jgi:hypothetical protein
VSVLDPDTIDTVEPEGVGFVGESSPQAETTMSAIAAKLSLIRVYMSVTPFPFTLLLFASLLPEKNGGCTREKRGKAYR